MGCFLGMDRPVKPVLTIRHLIASSMENEKKKESLLRSGPFRWQRLRRRKKTADQKEQHIRIQFESEKSEESDEFFSDALSNTEMDACSLSMVSDMNTNDEDCDDGDEGTSRRNFIMDRFLPAATAMASESQAPSQQTYRPMPPRPVRKVSLPLQSRPYLMKKNSIRSSDEERQSRPYFMKKNSIGSSDDEDDERVKSLKVACGGLFCMRLKKNGFGVNPLSLISPRRKPNLSQSNVYNNDGEESSSGTDEERAVIMATRRKALEGRYRQQQQSLSCSTSREFSTSPEIGQALLNRISYTTDPTLSHSQSQSPLRKPTTSPSISRAISPYRNEASLSPFSQERKGFLGFPTDRRAQHSKAINMKDNFQNSNDNEQEDCYYSGHSSPRHSSSDSSAAPNTTPEIPCSKKNKNELKFGSGNSPVSVLPPPLPKSPTESWLWRAIPQLNNHSSTQATIKPTKPSPEEFNTFDDAKWEI